MLQGSLLRITQAEVEPSAVRIAISMQFRDLRSPLTDQKKVAYNIMFASLLEADGLPGALLARCYERAAITLANKICKNSRIVLLPSIRILEAWLQRAIDAMTSARGTGSAEVKKMEEIRKVNFQKLPDQYCR